MNKESNIIGGFQYALCFPKEKQFITELRKLSILKKRLTTGIKIVEVSCVE